MVDFSRSAIMYQKEKKSELLAIILSFGLPGAGIAYASGLGKGFLFFILTVIGYICLVIPGLILHLYGAVVAYNDARDFNARLMERIAVSEGRSA
jgi:TM2 domain-containing membrane protein YozV